MSRVFPGPLKLILAVAMLAMLSACAHLDRAVKAPDVILEQIDLESFSLSRQRFAVRMNVTNTNDFRLRIREITYDLQVHNVALTSGVFDESISLAGGESDTVTLRVETDLLTTGRGLMDWLRNPGNDIAYQIEGKIQPDVRFSRAIPYQYSGRVELNMP